MFVTTVNSTTSEDNGEYSSADDDDKPTIIGSNIIFEWERRKVKLGHDYAITGWSISVMHEVRANVEGCLTGYHSDAIKRVVSKLHEPPCPKKSNKIQGKTMGEILHTLWLDFKHFQKKTGPLHKNPRWLTSSALTGSSHIWHELYLLAYTEVLGSVSCRTTSKPLGIVAYERIWGDV